MGISIIDLGRIPFLDAFSKQISIQEQVLEGVLPNSLILCEHPHTVTLPRKFKAENILDRTSILDGSIDFIVGVNRGGDITYHGPGQLMGYLIFDLRRLSRDLGLFINKIEDIIINTLNTFGIDSSSKYGFRGVWVKDKKIASIGLGVNKWVTIHGFGLNVNTDLKFFEMIRPCGMNIKMTSVEEILGSQINLDLVKEELIKEIEGGQKRTRLTERSECKSFVRI